MSTGSIDKTVDQPGAPGERQVDKEFAHLKSTWWCFLLLGILLMVCGTAAVVFPALTVLTSLVATAILGVVLIVAGVGTILASFWAGKWSGLLVQLLVGIFYIVAGLAIADTPVQSAAMMALFVAAFFMVVGAFRVLAAFIVRFPHWGWALLNGLLTFLVGVVIYRHFPSGALWVVGVLVGVEMLLHGWTWILLSLAIRDIPDKQA
jgi:uncharacterized membrane protein HdeD (DUF308 family)